MKTYGLKERQVEYYKHKKDFILRKTIRREIYLFRRTIFINSFFSILSNSNFKYM